MTLKVFLRELISNASDALEKHRYAILNENSNEDIGALEIRISSDKQNRILIIQVRTYNEFISIFFFFFLII